MALTETIIEVTFGNAISQARQLEDCADQLDRIVTTDMENVDSELRSAWQGNNAEMYLSKLNLCADNLSANAQQLRNIAASIRRYARLFRESELRAIEIAKTE